MFCQYKSAPAVNPQKIDSTLNLVNLAVRVVAAKTRIFPLLSAIALLFLFVGSAHSQNICAGQPCILVSNYATGEIQIFSDDGSTQLTSSFLTGYPSGAGGGEGIACTSGSNGIVYVSDNGPEINAFNLANGMWLGTSYSAGSTVVGMTVNAAANLIYAGDYSLRQVVSLQPTVPPSSVLNVVAITPSPDLDWMHDVALGTFPAALQGDVFTSYFDNDNSGVDEFQNVSPYAQLQNPVETLPFTVPYANGCATFTNGTHCWERVSGIAFDANGNLWANSTTTGDNGTFEFYQTGSTPTEFVPVNFIPSVSVTDFPIGITVAPLTDPLYPGYILTADLAAGTVSMINPASCTGSVGTPGTCTRSLFFTTGPSPKYVVYNQSCPSTANDGYIEVCKQSNPAFPVTGTFDFTVTAPLFSSGTLSVPVGECSGPIQVPPGTVTVTETPQAGVSVSDVTAYSYTSGGSYDDELVSWTSPNPYATVGVQSGNNVALETIATFTNSADGGQTGQLKICKTAGTGVAVGTPFTFTATEGKTKTTYTIEAGPASQGGNCELAGTFPSGTQVTVKETLPKGIYASIAVEPPSQAGKETADSVVVTIGTGITEVNFTDSTVKPSFILSASPSELNVAPGQVGKSTITITPVNGFTGSVKLSATALNNATGKSVGTVSFNPNPATSTSTMVVTVSPKAITGAATITITGTSGSVTATTTIALTVE